MQLSENGEALIKSFEEREDVGYMPTPNDKPTAGWGHTGPDVEVGETYDMEQEETWFSHDVAWAEACISNVVKTNLNQNQFDALVSFCFNVGETNFNNSTLLRKLNAGDYNGAADQFPLWVKQKGIVLDGLVRRRAVERELFLKEV